MTVQYVSESSEGQLQQLIDLVISATGKSPPEHRRNGMEAPRGDHESFVGQTHRRSFMLIPAPSLEPLIHPACLSLDGGSRPKQSTRKQKKIHQNCIRLTARRRCWHRDTTSSHTVHTRRDYAVSSTHPPSLWQQSRSNTSVILAGAAWCCK